MENSDSNDNSSDVVTHSAASGHINDYDILTRQDAESGKCTFYDACVCYADEDEEFVFLLARVLESEKFGFRLFLRERDMLAGHFEYEKSLQIMEKRSKRMIVILSPDFLKCPAYEALAGFAAITGINERYRKLIPVLYKPCENVPSIFKFFSKIDCTKGSWRNNVDKIVDSLREIDGSSWFSQESSGFRRPASRPPVSPSRNIFYAIDTISDDDDKVFTVC